MPENEIGPHGMIPSGDSEVRRMGPMDREVYAATREQLPIEFEQPEPTVTERLAPKAKPSKKHQRKGKALRDMSYETLTPAQVIMRDEMARGLHQPERAGLITAQLFGKPGPYSEEAIAIIHAGPNITLSVGQWVVVQGLVEQAYRAGYDRGKSGAR